jgi:hypothetical protein
MISSLGTSKSGILSAPFSFLVVVLRVSAYESPLLTPLPLRVEGVFSLLLLSPWPIIYEGGAVVGGLALVTVIPTSPSLNFLPPNLRRIIFKCVGLVKFMKYWGFLHQN